MNVDMNADFMPAPSLISSTDLLVNQAAQQANQQKTLQNVDSIKGVAVSDS